jgi:geranylgeranyl diphosphate synthase type I
MQPEYLIDAGHDSSQVEMMAEQVILVDEKDQQIGAASKSTSHHHQGLLHRAFSVLVFDLSGRMLLQKRSKDKITFPGVWANACCSHPLNVEDERDGFAGSINAAIRKMEQELGVPSDSLTVEDFQPLTKMLYMSRMDEEWVEHELDHVMILQKDVSPNPNPNEIDETRWFTQEEWLQFSAACPDNGETIAPWFQLIADNLLMNWWNNLESLHVDGFVHRFGRLDLSQNNGLNESLSEAINRCRPIVEEKLCSALSKAKVERLRLAMLHLIEGGGKRLRATLPRIVGEALGNAHEGHDDVGAALEVIHNFTLVHDDIMDDDDVRRGRPAVHKQFDVPTAINAGDAMLAVGFEILANSSGIEMKDIAHVVLTVGKMVRKVSEGQQLDIAFENEENVGIADYLEMIDGKTAVMFQTAAELGALLAGADEDTIEACSIWGREVGMCFQLMDDLLDILSEDDTIGKPKGSDIAQGKKTLIALHALEQSGEGLQTFLKVFGKGDEVSKFDIERAIEALEELGSIKNARAMAEHHHAAANNALASLPISTDLNILRQLTNYQLSRIS